MRVVDREVRGEDERVTVVLHPEVVDHGGHQAQHASGALEPHEGRPVRVEAVEDLGVDRVRGLQSLLVVGVPALRRKVRVLPAVEVGERPGDGVPVLELAGVRERLEEPAPDDLEAFLGARRPERRLDPPSDVSKTVQRFPALLATDLDVVSLGVRRCPAVGRRGG